MAWAALLGAAAVLAGACTAVAEPPAEPIGTPVDRSVRVPAGPSTTPKSTTPTPTSPTPTSPTSSAPTPTTSTPTTPARTSPPAPVAPGSFRPASTRAEIGGCQVFPSEHFLNATGVDRLPVHPRSREWIAGLDRPDGSVRFPDSGVWQGSRGGMPINVVDSREIGFEDVVINPFWNPNSYRGRFPIPDRPLVQGHPGVAWDQHLLVLDTADCTAYELIQYNKAVFDMFGTHTALSSSRYSLDELERQPSTTNVASTPMIGQYVLRDEVARGSVDHVIGACTDRAGSGTTWPAEHSDGPAGADAIPMGSWLRLRADVDLAGFSGDARPVAEALRRHGAVLTDTCPGPLFLMAENSATWDDDAMDQIRALRVSDFEVVDTTPMQVDDEGFRIR